jgi:hypothetical protein
LGILCGTPLESIGEPDFTGQFLIAVDIDQDDLVEPVRHALRIGAARVCATKGKTGLTTTGMLDGQPDHAAALGRPGIGSRQPSAW